MWIVAYALRRPYRIAVFAVPALLSAAGKAMPPRRDNAAIYALGGPDHQTRPPSLTQGAQS